MFKRFYEDELEFLREMGAEFSACHPEIASELGLTSQDPDVERLLQGFAFLTARVRQTLDAQYPELLHPLMSQLWPHALSPTPAAGIVEFKPRPGLLQDVMRLPRGANLRSLPIEGTECRFRTCHDLDLVPLTVEELRMEHPATGEEQLRIRLSLLPGATLRRLAETPIRLHLHGSPRQAYGLYSFFSRGLTALHVTALGDSGTALAKRRLSPDTVRTAGWSVHETLLPYGPHSVSSYRHLHEYFLLPARFLFVDVFDLDWLSTVEGLASVELSFEHVPAREEPLAVSKENVRLHCVPVVNLFPHPACPVIVDGTRAEYRVRPESSRTEHYDVFSIEDVSGFSRSRGRDSNFLPFSAGLGGLREQPSAVLYQLKRCPSVTARAAEGENHRSYPGADTYISFVTPDGSPLMGGHTVSLGLLVTNRDLPRQMKAGDLSVPTTDIPSCVTFSNLGAMSSPTPAPITRDDQWRYLSYLQMGWHQLADRESFSQLLALFHIPALFDRRARQSLEQLQGAIERLETIADQQVTGQPPALVHGTHLRIFVHEGRFTHVGELDLLGATLSHFLGEAAPLNTFVRLSIIGLDQGLELTWLPRAGREVLR